MHPSSYQKMTTFVEKYLDPQKELKILDVGAQSIGADQTYKPLFDKPNWTYIGCDISTGTNVDIVMPDAYTIPVDDNLYDVVISGQAMEHMEFFWITMKEIARVVKPNGLVCLIAPGRGAIHRYPIDCWRFYPDGMDVIIKWMDFIRLDTYIDQNSEWWDCVLIAQKKPTT